MIKEQSSFRDPDSVLEFDSKFYYRKMSDKYLPHYLFFKKSGLKDELIKEGHILLFEEIYDEHPNVGFANQVIKTQKIPFVSYPYEWSFSQFKEAALLTLKINLIALKYGMILKDASMFNVQFIGSKPIFIDLGSFEIYKNNSPWAGYQQFCRHFLAPLLLASYKDFRLIKLLIVNIDGIDLSFVRKLLPIKSYFNSGVFLHIILNTTGLKTTSNKKIKLKKQGLKSILIHLTDTIENLKLKNKNSEWADYYNNTNYSDSGLLQKASIIEAFINGLNVKTALDVGANDGKFSKLLSNRSIYTVSTDIDELAVEKNFIDALRDENVNLLSLHLNLANPTPSIGWDNIERKSFYDRAKFDLVLALAVVHHFVITYDLSFEMIAEKFSKIGKYLIIEFPLPEDEKVQLISINKLSQFSNYNIENFKSAFEKYFSELDNKFIESNSRVIFLYAKKD
jgi:hypothetical protein